MTGPVLVTGAGGRLGGLVADAFEAVETEVARLRHADCDVTDEGDVARALEGVAPDLVIHCAAMTNVDACEERPDEAWTANATYTGNIARAAARTRARLIAVSTDYVFDGEKGSAYTETDEPRPIQEYGRSKLGGEAAVAEETSDHWIVRSAWIYGPGGKSFISQLPGLAAGGGTLTAVSDQTGSPTSATDLAAALVTISTTRPPFGIYHVTNAGACTFAELVHHVVASTRPGGPVKEVSRRDLGLRAPRPENTSLANDAWAAEGLHPLRDWREAVTDFVRSE